MSKIPHICANSPPRVPISLPIHWMNSYFGHICNLSFPIRPLCQFQIVLIFLIIYFKIPKSIYKKFGWKRITMTLNATRLKVPHICLTTVHNAQMSPHFTVYDVGFPDNSSFRFPNMVQWWIWNPPPQKKRKSWKLETKNLKKSSV